MSIRSISMARRSCSKAASTPKIPSDLPEKLVMSALDVAGAPAQVAKLVRPGNTVLIIGAAGKSGMLCCYEARKRVGVTGKVIGLCYSPEEKERLDKLGFCHEVVCMDARQPIPVLEKITELTNGEMCDITINNVNVPDTEMTSILSVRRIRASSISSRWPQASRKPLSAPKASAAT